MVYICLKVQSGCYSQPNKLIEYNIVGSYLNAIPSPNQFKTTQYKKYQE